MKRSQSALDFRNGSQRFRVVCEVVQRIAVSVAYYLVWLGLVRTSASVGSYTKCISFMKNPMQARKLTLDEAKGDRWRGAVCGGGDRKWPRP